MAQSPKALDILTEVARRSLTHASPLPAQREVRRFWSGVCFKAGDDFVALPINEVSETLDMPTYTRLPGVQPWVLGVANIRGRIVALTDVAVLLGGEPVDQRRAKVVVIDSNDVVGGLVVDQLFGIQHFPEDELTPNSEENPSRWAPFTLSQGHFRDEDWNICSAQKLVEKSGFMNTAAKVAV